MRQACEYHEAKDIPIIIFIAKEITADKGKARNRHKEDNQEGSSFQGRHPSSLGDKAPFYPERHELADPAPPNSSTGDSSI